MNRTMMTLCYTIVLCILHMQHDDGTLLAQTFVSSDRLVLGTEKNLSASVRLGDIDADGDLDAVVANGRHWPQQNYLFLNQGRSRFSVLRPIGVDRCTSYACELADFDGDGDLDIAIGNDMATCQIAFNDGKGHFSKLHSFGEPSSVRSLTVSDIDQDGDVDILATCRGLENLIYVNDGKGEFSNGGTFGSKRDSTIDVAVGDVNKDGQLDLVLANRDNQTNTWLINNGKSQFVDSLPFGDRKSQSRAVAVGDMNGDGHLDWATGNIGQSNSLYFGDGTGAAIRELKFGAEDSRTYCLSIFDMDDDGDLDIVVGNVQQSNAVFFNNGDGASFQEESFGSASTATYGLAVGDLTGDGLPDIAVANSNATNRIYVNRGNRSGLGNNKRRKQISEQESAIQVSKGDHQLERSSEWRSFRGTNRQGIAEGFALPLSWHADPLGKPEGLLWETNVPGLGHSSPVIAGDKLFLLTAVATEGEAPLQVKAGGKPTAADDGGVQQWLLVCYNKFTGRELWRRVAREGKPRATRHTKATHANTSVCVSENKVLAFLGSEGLYCYDLDGKLLWSKDLGVINISKYGIGWGFASSPVVFKDQIVVVCDDPANPFLAVLRLNDGTEVWRKSRKGVCERSWSTPLIHEKDGVTQVVVNGWPWIASYNLSSGEVLWQIEGGGDNPVPSPFVANGFFYITNAHGGPAPIHVVHPEARGRLDPRDSVTKSPFVWSVSKGGSYMSTPIVYKGNLYLGNSNGTVRCFDAVTGEKRFEGRLGPGAGIIASLVAGDGKVYCASENGTVYVLAASDQLDVIARNEMGQPCLASPAISQGVIFFRTTKRLVAIGNSQ